MVYILKTDFYILTPIRSFLKLCHQSHIRDDKKNSRSSDYTISEKTKTNQNSKTPRAVTFLHYLGKTQELPTSVLGLNIEITAGLSQKFSQQCTDQAG